MDQEKNLSEVQVRSIMIQLILTVDLMLNKNIYHRDLKPDNILILEKDEIKVCVADLGLACRSTDTRELPFKCGTPGYVAPELLKGFSYGNKSDIFSLGSLFYNIVTGKMLFSGPDKN